ncbi:MAG: hypothetical protein DMG06_03010, partial [Acidobacteria bacterium]
SLPYPVEVKEGTRIGQSIKLNLKGKASAELPKIELTSSNVTITVDQKSPTPLPLIGLGMASHGHSLTNKELQRLKQLNLSHLPVDLKLSEPHYQGILSRAASEAKALGVSLEVALFLGDSAEAELTNLAREPGSSFRRKKNRPPNPPSAWRAAFSLAMIPKPRLVQARMLISPN